MGPRGLAQQLDQLWHKRGMLPRGGRLLVAVSGGADSVALLRLLMEINRSDYWGWTLIVGHVSHGMRGRAGEAHARFVERLAKGLGVKFAKKSLRLGKGASEAAARAGRYAALVEMARRHKAAGVVLGHHADDQAETVLLRLFRGTSIAGLGAMAAESEREGLMLWRPLLTVRRAALRAYLEKIGQRWREDETNAEAAYTRNRLRASVMPAIEAAHPEAAAAIGRLAELARESSEVIDGAAMDLWKRALIRRRGKRFRLRREVLREALPLLAREALLRAVQALGGTQEIADYERLQEALRLVRSRVGGKRVEMGRGVTIVLGKEVIIEA